MAAATATNEQLTATMHECISNITGLTNRIMLLEQRIASDHGPRGHEGNSGLVDKKFFQPEPLGNQDVFREWAEDFTEYVRSKDEEMANLMDACRYSEQSL